MEARLNTLASALGIVETDTRQGFERLWTFVRDAHSRLAPLVASAPEVSSLGMSLQNVGHTIGALERRVSACESGPPLTVAAGTLQEAIEEAVGDQVSTLVNDFLDGHHQDFFSIAQGYCDNMIREAEERRDAALGTTAADRAPCDEDGDDSDVFSNYGSSEADSDMRQHAFCVGLADDFEEEQAAAAADPCAAAAGDEWPTDSGSEVASDRLGHERPVPRAGFAIAQTTGGFVELPLSAFLRPAAAEESGTREPTVDATIPVPCVSSSAAVQCFHACRASCRRVAFGISMSTARPVPHRGSDAMFSS